LKASALYYGGSGEPEATPTIRLRDLVDATLTQLRAKSPAENSNEFDVHDLHLSILTSVGGLRIEWACHMVDHLKLSKGEDGFVLMIYWFSSAGYLGGWRWPSAGAQDMTISK
jgi:hypothetical protein